MPDDPIAPTAVADPTPAAPATPAKQPLAHIEKLRAKSLTHNLATCLCPFCRRRRKVEGVPNPPETRKRKEAKTTDKPPAKLPAPQLTDDTTGMQHDPQHCLCSICSQWRKDRASAAAKARYEKEASAAFDWATSPLPEAEQHLANLRQEIERGARVLRDRSSTASQQFVKCEVCHKDIINGRWAQSKVIYDPATQLPHNIFFCSSACIASNAIHPEQHGPPTGEPTGLHPEQRRH